MKLDFSYRELDYVSVGDKIELNLDRLWSNRGHSIGEGMVSPDNKYFYVNIPKNSSSFIKSRLTEIGWEYANIKDYPNATPIVVLREPISRWVSGISEYLFMYHLPIIDNLCEPFNYDFYPLIGEKLGMGLLFDKITFDDHTERQCMFLTCIKSLNDCIWLKTDSNFNKNFSELLTNLGYPNNFEDAAKENSSDGTQVGTLGYKKNAITKMFKYIIDNDHFKKYNLQQWFWCDYELINKVIK